jgi:hypothetical protein
MVGARLKSFRRRRRLFSLAVVSRPGKNTFLRDLCASVVNLSDFFGPLKNVRFIPG